jgi:hypothetical protein
MPAIIVPFERSSLKNGSIDNVMKQISKAVLRFLRFPALCHLHSPARTFPVPRSLFVESFESAPRLPGDADRPSLTIFRKQLKIETLSFLIMSHQGRGGVGSE